MDIVPGELLKKIDSPADLRLLKQENLVQVSKELREYIIDMVSRYGGHFGASLGVVELTVALHYTFNTPYDQLVWDVGHQAYGHKILTGRRDNFHTNRVYKGLSGFPRRSESEYDTFGVGHSSTGISAALGMAVASRIKGELDRHHVVVVGDGAITAGLAYEGLNNAGAQGDDTDLLIILNDNCMSIDPNVGALKQYLTDLSASPLYNKTMDEAKKAFSVVENLSHTAKKFANKLSSSLETLTSTHKNLFEFLNFRYFGPVDGHDVEHLVNLLNDLKKIKGPKFLHVVTVKGKGYELAEKDQTKWHSPGTFDKITGEIVKKVYDTPQPPKYQDVFGNTVLELAENNNKIVGVTPAMLSGSSLSIMMKAMPERTFDVGIAEQHAVTFSAGMATQGLIPFCNIYSSFMQRGYDQVIHDVAIQNLHVIFCLDRAGLVGSDGATHHGAYDIAYMRCVPNMIVCSPLNESELRNLMYTAQLRTETGPWSIRYPRGNGVMADWKTPFLEIEIGTGQTLNEGEDLAVITFGPMGNTVLDIAKSTGNNFGHYDLRFVKPLDEKLLHHIFKKYKKIITVEDGSIMAGMGSAVLEFAADNNYTAEIIRLGIPDRVVEHGEPQELYAECGFDKESIKNQIEKLIKAK